MAGQVTANILQIGDSGTATQNFVLEVPNSPDGTVALKRGNHGATSADVLLVSSTGQVGIGVTPSAWSTGKAVEFGVVGNGVWYGSNAGGDIRVVSNYYYNAGEKFAGTGYATSYTQSGGIHAWYTSSASGTAGNAATMNTLMTLAVAGNLGVGVTPSAWSLGKAIEVGFVGGGVWGATQTNVHYLANLYYNSGYKFAGTGYATQYAQEGGTHTWLSSSASGTAGNTATMNTLMTLSTGGNLTTTGNVEAPYCFGSSGIYVSVAQAGNTVSNGSLGGLSNTLYIGNASINVTSDSRLKTNIRPTERDALALIGALEVVDHGWNDPSDQCENNRNSRGEWTGLIAQQAIKVTPWVVNAPDRDCPTCLAGEDCAEHDHHNGPWRIEYDYLVPLLVKGIQEIRAEFNAYKEAHP